MNYEQRQSEIALGERDRPEPKFKDDMPKIQLPVKDCGCSRYEHCQSCVEEVIKD